MRRALALAVVLLGAAPHPISGDFAYSLGKDAEQLVTRHDAPSVSVAVVESNGIAFTHAAGTATPDTVYAVGSITKMFTAVSIFQLIDAAEISLDDSLAKYLPNFPNAKNITVRQLLSHQAGINDYLVDAVHDGLVYAPTTSDALVTMIAKAPPQFAPGANWRYSNCGYVLLGKVVEAVAHEPLATYEGEHIFKVAGMQQTGVGQAPEGLTVAQPFMNVGFLVELAQPDYSWYYACGDILSTASDLARFDIALMSGKLVSASSFTAMQRVVHEHTILPDTSDGLGLFKRPLADVTLVGHHGGEPGYSSDNEMIPADGLAVVILDNGQADTDDTLSSIVHALYWSFSADGRMLPPPKIAAALTLFQDFFTRLQASTVDRSSLSEEMNASLNSDMLPTMAKTLRGWGTFNRIDYQNQRDENGYTTYFVQLLCSKGSHDVRFAIDKKTGKLAGFYISK